MNKAIPAEVLARKVAEKAANIEQETGRKPGKKECRELKDEAKAVVKYGRHPLDIREVLDPCCGSRMMWFNKADQRTVFGDRRSETIVVTDNSRGNARGTRTLRIEPDTLMDFRALPFPDGRFKLVAFDPPHLEHAGPRSWLAAKYGKLGENWRDDLREGFAECWRVLASDGVLVFKWNETQVKVGEVLALAPAKPLFGQVSGRSGMTHWLVFMKP